jgi:hypothetical protein
MISKQNAIESEWIIGVVGTCVVRLRQPIVNDPDA